MERIERRITTISIKNVLKSLMTQEYKIPSYQRDFVWKQDDLLLFLDSVIKNAPLSSITIWVSENSKIKSKPFANIVPTDPKQIEKYVLDGQQRITTAYIIRYGFETAKNLCVNLHALKAFCNGKMKITSKMFEFIKPSNNHIPFTDIFNQDKVPDEWFRYTTILANLFEGYQITVEEVEATPEQAEFIFERCNTTGKELTTLEAISPRYSRFIDLPYFITEIMYSISSEFEGCVGKNNCDPIKLLIPVEASVGKPSIVKIDAEQVAKQKDIIKKAYLYAAEFLVNEGISKKNKTMVNNQLLNGIAYFFYLNCGKDMTETQIIKLKDTVKEFESEECLEGTNAFVKKIREACHKIYEA